MAGPATQIEIAEKAEPGAAAARYVPDVNRAASELGLVERIRVTESIRRTMEWHGGQTEFHMKESSVPEAHSTGVRIGNRLVATEALLCHRRNRHQS